MKSNNYLTPVTLVLVIAVGATPCIAAGMDGIKVGGEFSDSRTLTT
ncbi:MAG: hypothetical protein O3C40_16560 [Planctomycetota bacterium]|nr:hypothetical protein [Planctomycetota bacterium]